MRVDHNPSDNYVGRGLPEESETTPHGVTQVSVISVYPSVFFKYITAERVKYHVIFNFWKLQLLKGIKGEGDFKQPNNNIY